MKVSVVMSFYSEPIHWMRLAVESVLTQSFRDFEFIIICDNPEYAEGITYIKDIGDDRIRLIVNETNLGPTKSFNVAIAAAKGDYIARMDADDICLPERFESQVGYLDAHPEVSVCATDTHLIDKDGYIRQRNCYRKKKSQALNFISNSIAHPTVMFRKSLLELRNPIYNEDYIYSQDYELWTYLILHGHRIHRLDQALLLYRKSGSQITSSKKKIQGKLFKKAHSLLIINWLLNYNIIRTDETDNLETMTRKASASFHRVEKEDRESLKYIIYILYFTLVGLDWRYRFRYLADRNLIFLRIRSVFTYRLLFAKKARRENVGLI